MEAPAEWGPREFGRALARLAPVRCLRALGDEPWQAQADILEAVWSHRETYVRSAHAIGKTWLAARIIALWVLAYGPDVLVVCVAPTEDQIVAGVWRELGVCFSRWSALLPGELGAKIWTVHHQGIIALGRSPRPERPGTLQGLHHPRMLTVIDEAPEVDPRLWNAIRSFGSYRLLAIGNPTRADGPFYRASLDPLPGTAVMSVDAFTAPNLRGISPDSPTLAEDLLAHIDDQPVMPGLVEPRYVLDVLRGGVRAEWCSRVMAEFPMETEDTLIPMAWVTSARANVTANESYPLEVGIDVARFGADRTVLLPRRGPVVFEPVVWRQADLMASCGRIVEWARGRNVAQWRVDAAGLGAGLMDRMAELRGSGKLRGEMSEVVHAGAPNDAERFADRRSEYWWSLRDRFQADEIDLSRLEQSTYAALQAELCSVRYHYTSRGRLEVERKEQTKARLGRSPDLADALVYAFMPGGGVYEPFFASF